MLSRRARQRAEAKSAYPDAISDLRARQGRNVLFTINETALFNPKAWYDAFKVNDMPPSCSYLVYQLERGIENGLLHVQGYAEFSEKRTIQQVKDALQSTQMHIEWARDCDRCDAYCKKTGADGCVSDEGYDAPVIRGERKAQGKRTDLEAIATDIIKGKSLFDVSLEHPSQFIRYNRGFNVLANMHAKKRKLDHRGPRIYYIWGPPGCGKTAYVHDRWPTAYIAKDNIGGWMDYYNGEDAIIFDEFCGQYPANDMLTLLDRYACRAPVKGSWTNIAATAIVFTSNMPPDAIYAGLPQYEAWMRRLRDFARVIKADEHPVIKAYVAKLKSQAPEVDSTEDELDI